MPEYTSAVTQTVAVGANVLFTETPVPCTKGYVVHRDGAGITTLRGIVNGCNNCNSFARYKVAFGGNIAVPEGETVSPIEVTLDIDGEPIPSTTMIVSPTTVQQFFNVSVETFVTVPKGCCTTIAISNTSTIPIEVSNANIVIERTA